MTVKVWRHYIAQCKISQFMPLTDHRSVVCIRPSWPGRPDKSRRRKNKSTQKISSNTKLPRARPIHSLGIREKSHQDIQVLFQFQIEFVMVSNVLNFSQFSLSQLWITYDLGFWHLEIIWSGSHVFWLKLYGLTYTSPGLKFFSTLVHLS